VEAILARYEKAKAAGLHQLNTNELEGLTTPEAIALRDDRLSYVKYPFPPPFGFFKEMKNTNSNNII